MRTFLLLLVSKISCSAFTKDFMTHVTNGNDYIIDRQSTS